MTDTCQLRITYDDIDCMCIYMYIYIYVGIMQVVYRYNLDLDQTNNMKRQSEEVKKSRCSILLLCF